jgi:predicted HTH transcriptional regulator
MISKLSLDEILKLIQMKPEQAVFDWKVDFEIPNDPEKQGELIKDVTAIANAITLSPGFIVYGTDPRQPNPVLGISKTYDDAKLQQLFKDKVRPAVDFIYYEVSLGPKIIGVVQVSPTRRRPHIISVNIGKMKDGQIPIRRGSSTEGVKIEDLFEMFYGDSSGYFPTVLQKQKLNIMQQQTSIELIKLLEKEVERGERDMWRSIGLPPEFH